MMWKRIASTALALIMALSLVTLTAPAANAETETEGDYEYEVYNGNAYITKYTGKATKLTIPAKLGGYPVADMLLESFAGGSFTSVTFPDSVTSIGDAAFAACTKLTSITFPKGLKSLGDGAFANCTSLASIAFPNSVTYIGDYAFNGCTKLTSITIPNNVTYIGVNAFNNTGWYNKASDGILYLDNWCLGYKGNPPGGKLSLKTGTRGLARSAFNGCTSLTSVTIPNSVTSIGMDVFSGCSSLTSVTIPNSVKSIGAFAFYGCTSLTNVTIPNSVTYIGDYAFANTGWHNKASDGILYLDTWCLGYKGKAPSGKLSLKRAPGVLPILRSTVAPS